MAKKKIDPKLILDCMMDPDTNDAEAKTVKEYLVLLLETLWAEDEGFSGKRPFGNSGWQYELYIPLIKAGFIEGTIDEYGYLQDFDETTGHKLISLAISAL